MLAVRIVEQLESKAWVPWSSGGEEGTHVGVMATRLGLSNKT